MNNRTLRLAIGATWWTTWWCSVALYAAISRAGLLAALLGLCTGTAAKLYIDRGPPSATPLVVGIFLLGVLQLTNVQIEIPDRTRNAEISFLQYQSYVLSIIETMGLKATENTGSVTTSLARKETIQWRLDWWKDISAYTLAGGDYFWQGKGYGINLALDDGFSGWFANNRNPHNGFFTVLARSGVIGASLFIALLSGVVAGSLLALRRQRNEEPTMARAIAWLLSLLGILFFNSCFDVYLEGPMGGIWFWSTIGLLGISMRPNHDAGSRATPGSAPPQRV